MKDILSRAWWGLGEGVRVVGRALLVFIGASAVASGGALAMWTAADVIANTYPYSQYILTGVGAFLAFVVGLYMFCAIVYED